MLGGFISDPVLAPLPVLGELISEPTLLLLSVLPVLGGFISDPVFVPLPVLGELISEPVSAPLSVLPVLGGFISDPVSLVLSDGFSFAGVNGVHGILSFGSVAVSSGFDGLTGVFGCPCRSTVTLRFVSVLLSSESQTPYFTEYLPGFVVSK